MKKASCLVLALLLAGSLGGQPINAFAGETVSSEHKKPKRQQPKPEVDSGWLKEAGRVTAKTRSQSKTTTPGRKAGGKKTNRSTHRPVPRRPKTLTEIQMDVTDEQLHRLNDDVCSRLPDGTIEGPTRCKAWFDYLDSQRKKPTAEDAINQVRHRIQSQTVDVPMPKLSVMVQPTGRTLVNLDTIFYTEAKKQTSVTVPMLGYPVTLVGTPVSYTWHFGDRTADVTTTSPGGPYPSKEITHKYLRRGDVKVSVTVNYAATVSVAGGRPVPIEGTLPVTGPETALQVREAIPVLVDPPN